MLYWKTVPVRSGEIKMNIHTLRTNRAYLFPNEHKSDQSTDKTNWLNKSQISNYQKISPGVATFEQTAIAKLKEILTEAYEKLGVSDVSTLDTSPEATATRITDFAIGMYSIYKKQNPDMEEGERLSKYSTLIHGAIDSGFNEAVKILKGVNAFKDKVESDVNKTWVLIQSKLDDFFTRAKESLI